MERMAYKLKKLSNWGITVGAGIAFTISVITYVVATENLMKPASTQEAIEFLFEYSGEYAFALITGFVAKTIPWLLVFCAFGSVIKYFSDTYCDEDKKDNMRLIIVNVCLALVTMVIQSALIKFWGVLVLVIAVIMLFLYALLDSKR